MSLLPREAQNLLHSRFSCMLIPFSMFSLDYDEGKVKYSPPGGASSEAWNRLLMIAPVKKFDRARLSTDFLINKHGGDFNRRRVCADSQIIWLFDVQTSQESFGLSFT